MKIIILAAGKGQRYRDAGFTISKPLISYKNAPFIVHAIEQFEVPHSDIIVVGTPEVCGYVRTLYNDSIRTVCVEVTQRGPAMSALLAGGYIEDEESVIIMDSDGIFSNGLAQRFVAEMSYTKAEVGVMYTEHEGDTAAYCNLFIPEPTNVAGSLRSKITDLIEKSAMTKNIAVGGYGFKRWGEFRDVTMYTARSSDKKEVYMSTIIRHYTEAKLTVSGMFVPPEYWTSLGTPKDLDFAERNL